MDAQEYMAEQIELIAESMAHFIEVTDTEKRTWKPLIAGSAPTRSTLELAGECVATNRYFAALLRGEAVAMPAGGAKVPPINSAEEARRELMASSKELSDAVRRMTETEMDRLYSHWRGPTTGKKLVMGVYRNMAYHVGQINLIQILGGDADFHPPTYWY
jgi:hypothetical protein